MTTTPPTDAEIDAFVTSVSVDGVHANLLTMYGAENYAQLSGAGDQTLWVVAYTDNTDAGHFEGLGIGWAGVAEASDSQLEESSPPVANGGGPFLANGNVLGSPQVLPYLHWLLDSYGEITIRGYLLPGVLPDGPGPVNSTVHDWVNNPANWPAAA